MHPTGYILAVRAAHHDAESARPDAPVVPAEPTRTHRPHRLPGTAAVRRVTATSLRGLAAWIEPRPDTEPCRPATS